MMVAHSWGKSSLTSDRSWDVVHATQATLQARAELRVSSGTSVESVVVVLKGSLEGLGTWEKSGRSGATRSVAGRFSISCEDRETWQRCWGNGLKTGALVMFQELVA